MDRAWKNVLSQGERLDLVDKASRCLWTPDGQAALKYLTERRCISEDVLKEFKTGFIPQHVNHQLAGRLVYPIFDVYGELIALSTRHMYKEKAKSFWDEEFDKSFHLFGLQIAKKHILKHNKAIVVEGELDVKCFHSFGANITVGLCGSALTMIHVAILSRYCSKIFLCFDRDKGGEKAYKRAQEMNATQLSNLVDLIPARFDLGDDPDDFIKREKLTGLIEMMKRSEANYKEMGFY